MSITLESLELTDDVKHEGCWHSLTGVYKGEMYCLVGDLWQHECKVCPYFIEG